MKEKKKKLRYLWIALFVIAFAIANPKTAKAANENTKFQNAKEIPFEKSITEKYSKEDLKHQSRYYKFTVPKNIGNKWTCIQFNNRAATTSVYLYDDEKRSLDSASLLGTNDWFVFDTQPKGSAYQQYESYPVLEPGKTYYLQVKAEGWMGAYNKDFDISIYTEADDNWGVAEKAPKLLYNKWYKGILENKLDIDKFYVQLPNDKKWHDFIIKSDREMDVYLQDAYEETLHNGQIRVTGGKTTSYSIIGTGQKIYVELNGVYEATNYKILVKNPPKTITYLKIKKPKKGSKKIVGKTIKNANIKVNIGKKVYRSKSTNKGNFKLKVKKLKKGQKVKITVSKKGYKTRVKTLKVIK